MRLLVTFAITAAPALLIGAACGVSWRDVAVVLLVATAVLLGPEPGRAG